MKPAGAHRHVSLQFNNDLLFGNLSLYYQRVYSIPLGWAISAIAVLQKVFPCFQQTARRNAWHPHPVGSLLQAGSRTFAIILGRSAGTQPLPTGGETKPHCGRNLSLSALSATEKGWWILLGKNRRSPGLSWRRTMREW
jgi:hypothetical protein